MELTQDKFGRFGFETDTLQITFVPRSLREDGRQSYMKNARVFIWGVHKLEDVKASDAALPEPKNHGEDKDNDRAYAKHNRLYAKRAVEFAKAALEAYNDYREGEDTLRFSRTAGCSCPCSPGVVMNRRFFVQNRPVDIHVTIK